MYSTRIYGGVKYVADMFKNTPARSFARYMEGLPSFKATTSPSRLHLVDRVLTKQIDIYSLQLGNRYAS